MTDTTDMFVLRNIHGGSMKYVAHLTNGILTHVTRNGKTLARGKDLYHGRDYAFAADVYGKSHTVTKKARDSVTKLRRATKRVDKDFTGLKQKRPGGRPSVKARPKDTGRQQRQKRYEAIIRRIRGIRDCVRKEAQKVYKHYLPTICADYPDESNSPRIVMISRAISDPDKPITWLYKDEQSPKFLFGADDTDKETDITYLRATRPMVTYGSVIRDMPSRDDLIDVWAESESKNGHGWINTDFMTFIGCAADDVPVLG